MSLRLVEVQEQDLRTPADQPAPMLDWIQIERLRIDDGYQRALGKVNMTAIRRIADNFMWSRFTPVLVAPIEGGMFAIIDGQHRTHAALMCGFSAVPAMAVHVPRSEQARAFQWVNQQSIRVTPHQVYRAALAAGDDWARACEAAVAGAGCDLMAYNTSSNLKKPRQIWAVSLVRAFVEKGQAGAVTAALKAIRQIDETGRVGLYSDYVLRPWFSAVASNPSFELIDLAGVLKVNDPFKVIEAATRLRSQGMSVTAKDAFVKLLRGLA